MNPKAETIIRVLNESRPRYIVETGTIRNIEYEVGDGHSTRYIAEWVRDNGGVFTSIDLDIEVSLIYLDENGLMPFVNLWQGNSLDLLPKIKKIDFAYLDSDNDADLILNEFLIVWAKCKVVMVDDCSMESEELMKGKKLIPYLIENNIKFETAGYQLIIQK